MRKMVRRRRIGNKTVQGILWSHMVKNNFQSNFITFTQNCFHYFQTLRHWIQPFEHFQNYLVCRSKSFLHYLAVKNN